MWKRVNSERVFFIFVFFEYLNQKFLIFHTNFHHNETNLNTDCVNSFAFENIERSTKDEFEGGKIYFYSQEHTLRKMRVWERKSGIFLWLKRERERFLGEFSVKCCLNGKTLWKLPQIHLLLCKMMNFQQLNIYLRVWKLVFSLSRGIRIIKKKDSHTVSNKFSLVT